MALTYEVPGWREYRIDYRQPHLAVEPLDDEIRAVDGALNLLRDAGVLDGVDYDHDKFLAFRSAVRDSFEIPWTAITPRMQRLLYAINGIRRPDNMVAVGIFCGFTFISNAGAAIGPGAVYSARRLVGIEIDPAEAARARRNVEKMDPGGPAEILADDGLEWLRRSDDPIDLLYLDANGKGKGKAIYLEMVQAAERSLGPGSIVLAHNSINHAEKLAEYLEHVRNRDNFRESANMCVDGEGLEVTLR
jgi:predicted O-methyltransferase YrrM